MVSETDSLGLLSNQPKNAKSAIIQKLSKQWPLTAKQLTHSVQREYGMDITYQAVHKALGELEKENALIKEKNEWKLNSQWLQQHHTFIEHAIQKYQGKKNHYSIDLNKTEPQYFEFDNFTDFCLETAKLVANNGLCTNKEVSYWILEYGCWTLKFKFEHLEVLFKLIMSSPASRVIIRKKTPFGEWIMHQYERIGGGGIVGSNIDVEDDFMVQGEWVGQFHISKEGKNIIQKLWNKWKGLDDAYREFGLKKEPEIRVTATLSRNPALASFLHKQFDKYLKEGK